MFLDNLSFSKLIEPTTKTQFFNDYFGKQPLVIKRGNSNFYQGLLTAAQLDDVLFHWPNDATIVKANERDGRRQNLHTTINQNNTGTVLRALDEGSTLILDKLDHRVANLSQLGSTLEQELHYPFQSNVYITPPNSQGFKAHFDDHHVFILQTTGSKLWRVDNAALAHDTDPNASEGFQINAANHQEFLLEQGDLIYIPPYTVHEAQGQQHYSAHITLSPYPPTWGSLLDHIITKQRSGNSGLNTPLPQRYLDLTPEQMRPTIEQLLSAVIGELDNTHIQSFLEQQANDFRSVFSGALQYRLSAPHVTDTDYFQRNPNLMIHTRERADELQLITPNKQVDLPLLFTEQIHFCLSGKLFQRKDIPTMTSAEADTLLARLLAEGLIISVAN